MLGIGTRKHFYEFYTTNIQICIKIRSVRTTTLNPKPVSICDFYNSYDIGISNDYIKRKDTRIHIFTFKLKLQKYKIKVFFSNSNEINNLKIR